MEALDLAERLAEPVGTLGASFYFDAGTRARAHELGLNSLQFYGLGRAGVMGDVDAARVVSTFAFFSPTAIDTIWSQAKLVADPVATAEEYLRAAYAFADRTFGALDANVLVAVAGAVRRVVDATARGRWALVDGYRQYPVPENPVHGAYLAAILLRELRGGVHTDAVGEVGLDGATACYLESVTYFNWHGFTDAEAPEVTDELRQRRVRAEALTNEKMAEHFNVLGDAAREGLADGVFQMKRALSEPVAVTN